MRARLDTELVARGLTTSREQAKRLILAGAVRINGQVAGKPSDMVEDAAVLTVDAAEKGNGAKPARKVSLFDVQVGSYMKVSERIEMRGTGIVLFREFCRTG